MKIQARVIENDLIRVRLVNVGAKGEKGEKGDKGLDGRDGRDGIDGRNGKDFQIIEVAELPQDPNTYTIYIYDNRSYYWNGTEYSLMIKDYALDTSLIKEEFSKKVDKVEGKGLSSNDYDDISKAKVDAIPEDAKYTDTVYIPPTSYSADIIDETDNRKFVTELDKENWNGKQDKIEGKSLSTNDYTDEDKSVVGRLANVKIPTKLAELEEDTEHVTISDAERIKLSHLFVTGHDQEDLNDLIAPGIYEGRWNKNNHTPPPPPGEQYGTAYYLIVVFNDSNGYPNQLAINYLKGTIWLRYTNSRRVWQEWRKLNKTELSDFKYGTITLDKYLETLLKESDLVSKVKNAGFKTEGEIQALINNASSLKKEIVETLPTTGKDDIIYLIRDTEDKGDNNYLEYLWIADKFELVGSTKVDLTGYVTSSDLSTLETKVNTKLSLDDYNTNKTITDAKISTLESEFSASKEELKSLINSKAETVEKNIDTKLNTKVDKVEGKVLSSNDYTDIDKAKLDSIPQDAKFTDTVYVHPATHSADMIVETEKRQFVSASEKSTWNDYRETLEAHEELFMGEVADMASQISNAETRLSEEDGKLKKEIDTIKAEQITQNTKIDTKVDKVLGKELSSNDYNDDAKAKVDAIPVNPQYTDTLYTHPATHTADIIVENANKRFVSDADIARWNAKADKIDGKGFSENNYTNADKAKVDAIPENPKYTDTVYVHPNNHDADIIVETDLKQFVSKADKDNWNNKVDKIIGKGLSTNDYTTAEKNKLASIPDDAKFTDTVYTPPSSYSADIITENENKRFVSDAEKAKWNDKVDKVTGKGLSTNDYDATAKSKVDAIPTNPKYTDTIYSHPSSHPASMITTDSNRRFVSDSEKSTWNNKVDKVTGKGLSTNDYTNADKAKVDAIPENPKYTDTVYSHPNTHSAEMITESSNKKFVTPTEKARWNNKQDKIETASESDILAIVNGGGYNN